MEEEQDWELSQKKHLNLLVKIIDKPFLDHLLKRLIKYNFKKIYLLCSYKKEMFFELFHKKKKFITQKLFVLMKDFKKVQGVVCII